MSKWNRTHSDIERKIATPSQFFLALEKAKKRFEASLPKGWKTKPGIKAEGNVASQILEIERNEGARIGFVGDIPPLGYKVYQAVPQGKEAGTRIKAEEQAVETPFFRVEVDKETGIIQVFDKDGKLLVKGNELVIEGESGDLYHHQSRFSTLITRDSGE